MVGTQIKNSSEFKVPSSVSGISITQNTERGAQYNKLIQDVKEIYDWLDSQIEEKLSVKCQACGKCCDFENFEHRLFVTIPELVYMAANLNVEALEMMQTGKCPYNIEGKCKVHKYRFSGCRIFNCKANEEIQSELSELTLKKIKEIHLKFEIPYRYMDLASALNNSVISF